jgi:uncharacterized SAM-binding protein YcdF (DUF218 family)
MTWLLSPLAWLLLAGALALYLTRTHRRRPWLLAACAVVVVAALAAMTPMGANALVVPLERPVPAPRACRDAPPSFALVRGGGRAGAPRDGGDFAPLNLASRRRMDHAVAWWHEREGRQLVLVGGGARHRRGPALADLMQAYAQRLGLPAGVLRLERDSDDTWENARHSAGLEPRLPRRIGLVTSAMHMPRARAAFAHAGFEVCPLAGASERLPSRLPWAVLPRTIGLDRAEEALHEWAGLAYYRWRAR